MDLAETTFLIMAKVFHQLWFYKHLGLSSCVIAQELMGFHQDGGPALIVIKKPIKHGSCMMGLS